MSASLPLFPVLTIVGLSPIAFPVQMAAQNFPGGPAEVMQQMVQGPTFTATLRNAVQAASDQAWTTTRFAADMGSRTRGASYQMQNLWTDWQTLVYQFQSLQVAFSQVTSLAQQLQSARAANAASELDSALNIMTEAFAPVAEDLQAGVFNRDNVSRMCRVLNEALREWQRELKRNTTRLGYIR